MSTSGEMQQSRPKTRRPRAVLACELCRIKKNKCDEEHPACSYCRQRNVECTYRGSNGVILKRRFTPEYVRQLEEQVKTLQSSTRPDPTSTPSALSSIDSSPGLHRDWSYAGPSRASPSCSSSRQAGQEIAAVNMHTRSVEFYGTSSSVSLLSRVQQSEAVSPEQQEHEGSIVSSLHNPRFSPKDEPQRQQQQQQQKTGTSNHFHKCSVFIHGFFASNHYIHPILDKRRFLQRCETLWAGVDAEYTSTFVALYYSILSLGALMSVREEEPLDGTTNRQWSRRFFDEALGHCYRLGMVTDLEMVQCYFFLAKICQNELNPHWAYMYVGQAVRTALAIGINRQPRPHVEKEAETLKAEARTWWGLYSLEMEMSFAMGRPDTLGSDLHHNRHFPVTPDSPDSASSSDLLEPPHCSIIRHMVDFSRITRSVCLGIYLSDLSPPELMTRANQLERDLDGWVDGLPEAIRPERTFAPGASLRGARDARYAKRQRLVLTIRYHNLRILMFGSLLINSTPQDRAVFSSAEGIQKCLESAKQTIDLIYHVYQHHDFFHTWFYNITYISFATSIILVHLNQGAPEAEAHTLAAFVGRAVEILETMDECVVATKAAAIIGHALEQAQSKSRQKAERDGNDNNNNNNNNNKLQQQAERRDGALPFNHQWGPLTLIDEVFDSNIMFEAGMWDTEGLSRFLGEGGDEFI